MHDQSHQTDSDNPTRASQAPPADPYKWHALGAAALIAFTLPAILIATILLQPKEPEHPWTRVALMLDVEPEHISDGQHLYRSSCTLCHGWEAEGVARLGKPLRNSAYIQSHTADELFNIIAFGRLPSDPENTTGAVMPARANRGLSDEAMNSIVLYLRAIQDPTQPTISVDDWIIDTGDLSGGDYVAGIGHELFIASCSACHGTTGQGMDGLGMPLGSSAFVDGKSDEELLTFIKMGRPIWDENNTTGLDMPSKGGNPAISDEQLADIVTFIRSLHK